MAKKYIITALILIALLVASSCMNGPPKHRPGGPYYFKSWAHYFYPYIPTDEITADEAKELERQHYGYYIAFFNEDGKIKSFENRYKGKTEFITNYIYENGLIKREETNQDGKTSIIHYNDKGEQIRP